MKSCLGILIVFTVLVAVVGGGALVWYLSNTAEFARTPGPPSVEIPKAVTPPPLPIR
jgi:hypothetical protein